MRWRHKSPYQLTPDEALDRAKEMNLLWVVGRYEGGLAGTDEVIQAIVNAERERREHRLWVIALASVIAAAFSALGSWIGGQRTAQIALEQLHASQRPWI